MKRTLLLLILGIGLGLTGWGQSTYNLITSTTDLVAGAKYLIVSSQTNGSGYAMGYQNTSNRPQANIAITIASSAISVTPATTTGDLTKPYEITLGGSTGVWTLYDAVYAGYLRASSSSNNNLVTGVTADWTITFSSGAAVLTCTTGSFTRNIIRYNSASSLFSCYSSGQAAVYLYKLAAGNTIPSLSSPTSTTITNTSSTLGATITNNGGDAVTASGVVYGTSAAPTGNATATSPLVTTGVFTVSICKEIKCTFAEKSK